jgi:hypothetical protein
MRLSLVFILAAVVCTSWGITAVANVEVVHVVTMNHLDVGFHVPGDIAGTTQTLGYAANVINYCTCE